MSQKVNNETISIEKRAKNLKKLKKVILDHEKEINEALKLDLGKSEQESYLTEIGPLLSELNLTIKNLKRWTKPKKVCSPLILFKSTSKIYQEPFGRVLIISPWNYPFQLLFGPLIGAIAAGNQVVLKPSEVSKNSEKLIKKLIKENFNPKEIKVVTGGVAVTTNLLKEDFDLIFFTGSTVVGQIVMEQAAKTLTPMVLELGGKSPVIINDFKDLQVVADRIAWGKLLNAGQTCIAPDYVLIKKDLRDEFVQAYFKSVTKFYGDDVLNNPDYPKIINKNHYNRLMAMLDDDVNPLMEYQTNKEKIGPVIVEVEPDHLLMTEEIFGPILPIITYTKLDEAISFIEKRPKPLALYLFSEDKEVQQKVINSLSFGGATINDTIKHFSNPNLGFGGIGTSGIGQYHGKKTFQAFSHEKGVLKSSTSIKIEVPFFPSEKRKLKKLKRMMK